MKKILVVLALVLSLCVASSAVAWHDENTQEYFQAQVVLTDVVIDPVSWQESESWCHYSWSEAFSWGGLSIGMLAGQIQGAQQEMQKYGQQGIDQFQMIKMQTPGFELKMIQESCSYQYSGGYCNIGQVR